MNQVKIGRFIAERRKAAGFTQAQLAEKLCITDRAVSKWETGRAMPDSSVMLKLCELLKIGVNDLLCGEMVTVDNYNKELENNLVEMIKQKEAADKRLLALEWVVMGLSVLVLIIPVIVVEYVPMEEWKAVLIVLGGLVPCLIGLFFATKIEQVAGYYRCKACGHNHIPTFKAVFFAPHMSRTRRMKCPNCGKKTWQKKVISKD